MSQITPKAVFGALFALGLMLFASALWAAGQLDIVEKFTNGNTELAVATYTDPQADKSHNKVGLLGIASPTKNSFAFRLDEWIKLIDLCNKAIKTQSSAWIVVGSMTETGTEDVSQLTVSAGPSVSLVISSPKIGTVSYTLERSDLPRFQQGLQKVKDYLSK
jgi:hypothetical protein